jgi:hypothetical protein
MAAMSFVVWKSMPLANDGPAVDQAFERRKTQSAKSWPTNVMQPLSASIQPAGQCEGQKETSSFRLMRSLGSILAPSRLSQETLGREQAQQD